MPDKLYGRDYFRTASAFKGVMHRVTGFVMKNYKISPHSQEFYEINIIISGEGTHYFGNNSFMVKKGDVFIIPPMVLHGYDGKEGFDVYHILLHPQYIEKNTAELLTIPAFSSLFRIDPLMRERMASKLHLTLSDEELDKLMPRLMNVIEYEPHSSEKEIVRNAEVKIIIAILCGIYQRQLLKSDRKNDKDQAFSDSIAYIYEHYNEKIELDTLLHIALMSHTAYLDKFKKITGSTPRRFQNEHRIEVAKRLLMDTEQSVSYIATRVGFYDTPHFIKCFFARVGMSPSEFRRDKANR